MSQNRFPVFRLDADLNKLAAQGVAVFNQHPCPMLVKRPIFATKVAAGFASPADDYVEKALDLNELLIQKPAATFFVRAQGTSMLGAGIHSNDILVVDKSIEPGDGKVVIAAINGEFTVKRLVKNPDGSWKLRAENPEFADILLNDGLEFVVWGVVTSVIHSL